jgi:hypothetical protein
MYNIATVSPRGAATIIETLALIPKAKPIFLWGAFGVGKSAIVRQAVAALSDHTGEQWGFIDVRASQLQSVDTRGLPDVQDGLTVWRIPSFLPREGHCERRGVFFLDELCLGDESVQAALYQLLNERELGDYRFPDGWIILAASNRPEDNAGVRGRQDAALMTRFQTHLNVVPDVNEWIEYAQGAGISPYITGLIKLRGNPVYKGNGEIETAGLLHEYPNGGCPKGHIAVATPRTWEAASTIIEAGLPEHLEQAALQGCIGAGASAELAGFLRIGRHIPNLNEIFTDPLNASVPSNISAQYATAVALSRHCSHGNIAEAAQYLGRIDDELVALFFQSAVARDDNLSHTSAYLNHKINCGVAA